MVTLTISIKKKVINDIHEMMLAEQQTNRSAFCEELLRIGIIEYTKQQNSKEDLVKKSLQTFGKPPNTETNSKTTSSNNNQKCEQ